MNRRGSASGPARCATSSTYVLRGEDFTLFDRTRCVDYGDVFFHTGNMFDFLDQAERTVATILAAGASLLAFGGDHLIPLPIVRAYAKQLGRPLSLVHFDAHLDNWDMLPVLVGRQLGPESSSTRAASTSSTRCSSASAPSRCRSTRHACRARMPS